MSLVDLLWGLDLIAGRARAVGAEFLLSGPVNQWLQGVRKAVEPRLVLLTSPLYQEDLVRAITIGSEPEDYPGDLRIEDGLVLHVNLRGMSTSIVVDPLVRTGGGLVRVRISEYARIAGHALIEGMIVRLSPPSLERMLWGGQGGEVEEGLEE
ncbi:MAG: hypothetical protein F7C33_06230 [Desulfurococcales archaeon]|nr:hypothetical protein [Desulfurococcales archaeon]